MIKRIVIKPGDSILLKSGDVFLEPLCISAKGANNQPIVIGKYGGDKKPYLKGDGSYLEMVHVYNSENIVIRDLEISNKGLKPRPYLSGLLVDLHNYGKAKNILITNLYIHDIYGSLYKGDGYNNKEVGAGQAIMLQSVSGNGPDSIPSCFDGLTVKNCYIKDSQRNGIMMWGNWIRKYWFPSTHIIIEHNIIDGVPGDGIVPVGCEAPLIQYNIIKNCPKTLPPTEACDGIWPWSCDNAVIQYNIVSDQNSQVDGYGFDSDYNCTNSLFQYNLSFNNAGGFLLLCNSGGWPQEFSIGNRGTIVSYNISINDGIRQYIVKGMSKFFSPIIHITGPTENSKIEHNIIYTKKKRLNDMDKRIICSDNWSGYSDSTYFENNYIYVEEPTKAFDKSKATNNFFKGNLFVGPLLTPNIGFQAYHGKFDKKMWYSPKDPHWRNMIEFVKNISIPINGKMRKVLDIIGYN
ncbi:hypothetical protein FHX64_000712 [Microbacter margulisiae]|uniref:Right handed beta helix domain-containing protein n=2 Tax=Microbacter margulisiae TaxID=1350067 RepID=A0A7W5DQ72_9PORP|nr:hypothetical protein [Microbacter margulisiae]